MVPTLEVTSSEDSNLTDVTFAEVAPSTRLRSWKQRLLLFATPFCAAACGAICLQAMIRTDSQEPGRDKGTDPLAPGSPFLAGKLWRRSNLNHSKEVKPEKVEGVHFDGITSLQHLMGYDAGNIHEIWLENPSWKKVRRHTDHAYRNFAMVHDDGDDDVQEDGETSGLRRPTDPRSRGKGDRQKELVGRMWGRSLRFRQNDPINHPENIISVWPASIPFSPCETWTFAQDQIKRGLVSYVRFRRRAMATLLGSASVQPAAVRTWTHVASSVFGARFGRGAAGKGAVFLEAASAASAGQTGGWLGQELLEQRVIADKEPLVLSPAMQEEMRKKDPEDRVKFADELWKTRDGTKVASAYEVIANLFISVKAISDTMVTTILDMGEVFSAAELKGVLAGRLRGDLDPKTEELLLAAEAQENSAAAARRSGPRFLLCCLRLLEDQAARRDATETQDFLSDVAAAVEHLKRNLRKEFDIDLLPLLEKGSLRLARGGHMEFAGTFPLEYCNPRPVDLKKKGFHLNNFTALLGELVAQEAHG